MAYIEVTQSERKRHFSLEDEEIDSYFKLTIGEEFFRCLFSDLRMGILQSTQRMLVLALPQIKEFLKERIRQNPQITNFQDKNASQEPKDQPYFINMCNPEVIIHRIKMNDKDSDYQRITSGHSTFNILINDNDFSIECDSTHANIKDAISDIFFAVLEAYEEKIIRQYTPPPTE